MIFDNYQSDAMKHGTEKEDIARITYENEMFVVVEQVGFIEYPTLPNFGASPDGLVGNDGLIEIKCPTPFVHDKRIELHRQNKNWIDDRYYYQMQAQMMCTKRKWCDFVSFDDRFPIDEQMIIKRVFLDRKLVKYIENEVVIFNNELNKLLKK